MAWQRNLATATAKPRKLHYFNKNKSLTQTKHTNIENKENGNS